jgi:predicted nucleic acid-binding protein
MKIIFCDTNVVFGLFCKIQQSVVPTTSILMKMATVHDVFVSEYVFIELYNNYKADFGLDVSKEDLAHFVKIT